ncbi:lipase [Pseudoxanthomonas sp. LH2527]|uniref:lipase n=1 Tax=Pseudoxanthomonas sp. LH2527 TaxID=2923249 RepID=UPI001F147287|nr:lipase [Pseudoxanthomonas sp. LH2527]MCH6482394.1 lipase [Pseudoxanthomonas sp. LH2527]
MGLTPQQYAYLADHSYDRGGQVQDLLNKDVMIGGERYRVIDHVDNPRTGYQGTIYQHEASGAVVAAHRGTEFGREAFRDGVVADGGMVFARTNSQAGDAVELTRRAVEFAERQGREPGRTAPEVTVTGHSLGGTLAQVSAHHFDLRGQTFNAYGAASLDRRIPEGGDRVTNHVMAVDAVSSASPHYGEVRVYATAQEIETLHRTGYHDNMLRDLLQRDMPLTASVVSADSHSMHNFLPVDDEGRADRSALDDPRARRLADEHRGIIADYRDDVGDLRRGVTVAARGPLGLVLDGIDRVRGPLAPGAPAVQEARDRATGSPQAMPVYSITSTGPAAWQASPEIERLLAAARDGSPVALKTAQQDLQASALGQAWHARVDAYRQALDAQQRIAGPAVEQRMQAPLDIAR